MRLWHYKLLPYLPDAQFKGQLRELVAIMHDWRDKGETNHLLINRVMNYERSELVRYYLNYEAIYYKRYGKWINQKYWQEFKAFDEYEADKYTDYAYDNHKISFSDMQRDLKSNKLSTFTMGAFIAFALCVPLLNLIIPPAAVCAGTKYYLSLQKTTKLEFSRG